MKLSEHKAQQVGRNVHTYIHEHIVFVAGKRYLEPNETITICSP